MAQEATIMSLWKKLLRLPIPEEQMLPFQEYDRVMEHPLPPDFKAGDLFNLETTMTLDGIEYKRTDVVLCPAEAMRDGKVRLRFIKGQGWKPIPWEDGPKGLVWRK